MSVCSRLGCDQPRSDDPRAKWCSENCKKRAWEDENDRRACVECSNLLGAGAHRHGTVRCLTCANALRTQGHEITLGVVERLYNEGASYAEITKALGWKPTSQPAGLLQELREQGRIGYRYHACESRAA